MRAWGHDTGDEAGHDHPAASEGRLRLDVLDDAAQPRCPQCGTVMHSANGGFLCRGCPLWLRVIGRSAGAR